MGLDLKKIRVLQDTTFLDLKNVHVSGKKPRWDVHSCEVYEVLHPYTVRRYDNVLRYLTTPRPRLFKTLIHKIAI